MADLNIECGQHELVIQRIVFPFGQRSQLCACSLIAPLLAQEPD